MQRHVIFAAGLLAAALTVAVVNGQSRAQTKATAPDAKAVIATYANIAQAAYGDALTTAQTLQRAVQALIDKPTPQTLDAARKAWLAARVPYQQTEVYRFGNKIVDDWEGRVNAWPLDEGLIDYVKGEYGAVSDENSLYAANVIANKTLTFGGRSIDASRITKTLLSKTLHEADGVEANVATGYHAIEFLLWGQDLNGTGPGAGNRPATDFNVAACTGGNCARRVQYLKVATALLIDDLRWMAAQWGQQGAARKALMEGPADKGLIAIFTGMGSLSYGELAGERMKLGLLLHDPEEEHDCFADNTHNSHYYDVIGIQNVYLGRYRRVDGTLIKGASLSDLVKAASGPTDARLRKALAHAVTQFQAIVKRAESGEAYDQMIAEGNTAGNKIVQNAIDALLMQTKDIERAIAALKLRPVQFEDSDSLSDPAKVLQ
ncbi:MAG: imelysin family protein [Pseudomonadota bacterium]